MLGRCLASGSGSLPCGGLQGTACPEGELCQFTPAQRCVAGDRTGVCSAVPEGCTQEYSPVCSCDSKTYGNACTAHASSASVSAGGRVR